MIGIDPANSAQATSQALLAVAICRAEPRSSSRELEALLLEKKEEDVLSSTLGSCEYVLTRPSRNAMAARGQAPTRERSVVAPQVADYPRRNHDLAAAITIEIYLDKPPRRRHGAFQVAQRTEPGRDFRLGVAGLARFDAQHVGGQVVGGCRRPRVAAASGAGARLPILL